MAKTTPAEALTFARWKARKVAPYLGRGLFAMNFVESKDVATIGVGADWLVYYNPDYIARCHADGTIIGEVLHECLHPTMRHGPRAKLARMGDHSRMNVAGDLEIDQRIEQMSERRGTASIPVKLVDDRCTCGNCHVPRGLTLEEYYPLLKQRGGPTRKPKCSGGSGATGVKEPWEKPGGRKGLTEAQAKLLSLQIAKDIIDHAGKNPGKVPAELLRWAELFTDVPPIPWEDMTQAKIAYALDSRRGSVASYARPSRRAFGPFILPIHRAAEQRSAVVCDTSASMDQKAIGKALGVVHDACQALSQGVYGIACDMVATEPRLVHSIDELKDCFRGGGGTDMCAGIARALEVDPDVVVVVTDGGTGWPREAPEVPVVVVLTEPSDVPAWAVRVDAY